MLLIAGLGNPERDYKNTRHNIGFEVINKFAYDNGINMDKLKFRAAVGEGFFGTEKIMVLKPLTYMNLSGESVRDAMAYYKLGADRLIVVYDDTAIELGDVRIRKSGSAGGHNGMKNIIYQLETDNFVRLRVGIGEKPPRMELSDYVLSRFGEKDKEKMIEGVTKASDALELIIKKGPDAAMNTYNKKKILHEEQEDKSNGGN